MREGIRRLSIAAVLLAWSAAPMLGQGNPSGRISGTVTAQGQGLPGVLVRAASSNLQGTRETFTAANGDYLLSALPPGTYSLSFSLEGFAPQSAEIVVSAAQGKTFDTALEISAVEEEIVVTGNAETISEGSTGSTTYDYAEVVGKLATNRDLEAALELAPGVSVTGPGRSDGTGRSASRAPVVREPVPGQRRGGQREPPRPAARPLHRGRHRGDHGLGSGISAEYGRFTGGVVNVITKSGGNEFHGSLRDQLRPTRTGSRTTPVTRSSQDDDVNETYEATLGGPIWQGPHLVLPRRPRPRARPRRADRSDLRRLVPERAQQERYEGKLTIHLRPGPHPDRLLPRDRGRRDRNNFFAPAARPRRPHRPRGSADICGGQLQRRDHLNFFVEAQYSEREWVVAKGAGGPRDRHDGSTW